MLMARYTWYLIVDFVLPFRWASVPSDPEHAPQPGWQDHWYAAGDWQLRAASHAWVTWVVALKG